MIEIQQALELVVQHSRAKPPIDVQLGEAMYRVLAQPIVSDIDSPPYDKSMVDGYALSFVDATGGNFELKLSQRITAGSPPVGPLAPGTTAQVMTGGMMPQGADTVVMIERTGEKETNGQVVVTFADKQIRKGQHVLRRGTAMARGDLVFRQGHRVMPHDIGLLSEIGQTRPIVAQTVSVAILATGNELVAADQDPQAGQIRNSNGPMLVALASQAGIRVADLGIARDDTGQLRRLIEQGLESDILVLSGGVSVGLHDFVPQVLDQCGVSKVFHGVNLKPGKPVWFGCRRDSTSTSLVFGLPGNPVSSLVCFHLFVQAALQRLSGMDGVDSHRRGKLTCNHRLHGDRPTYWPSKLQHRDSETWIEPLDWKGSADLRTIGLTDSLAFFPKGMEYFAGTEVRFLPL